MEIGWWPSHMYGSLSDYVAIPFNSAVLWPKYARVNTGNILVRLLL